ncbi:hypothetical protein AALP_AA2G186000 [Arabis alpina]|uniref:Uncharacterized protein n=1 Tax=Arabis alpina TaxID=50452 RepID=A0A087HIE2_ARAAL|nr:hypothetical protein AALP_AA2G186000 [Arabis alpina]
MNEGFIMGQRDLLKSIKRRTTTSFTPWLHHYDPCTQLRQDRDVLIVEITRLREQGQRARDYIQAMEQRMNGAENKQRQMMCFLRQAVQNPSLLQQLFEKRKELLEEAAMDRIQSSLVKHESVEHVSELEALALEMQGYGVQRIDDNVEMELDGGFWEELLMNSDEEDANVSVVPRSS